MPGIGGQDERNEGSACSGIYSLLRQARNKRYRDTRPAHEYQKNYRALHPEYVKRNCELQQERNKKRQKGPASMIVKTYALMAQHQARSDLGALYPSNPV